MSYHTILKTSADYYEAMRSARSISANLTEMMNARTGGGNSSVEVFPYSVFYVFYEQYLTMWPDTLKSIGISLLAIFVVTFLLMGLDIFSSLVVIITITMIVVNIGGLMYWWHITLNAVSLVNLVMVSLFPTSSLIVNNILLSRLLIFHLFCFISGCRNSCRILQSSCTFILRIGRNDESRQSRRCFDAYGQFCIQRYYAYQVRWYHRTWFCQESNIPGMSTLYTHSIFSRSIAMLITRITLFVTGILLQNVPRNRYIWCCSRFNIPSSTAQLYRYE